MDADAEDNVDWRHGKSHFLNLVKDSDELFTSTLHETQLELHPSLLCSQSC